MCEQASQARRREAPNPALQQPRILAPNPAAPKVGERADEDRPYLPKNVDLKTLEFIKEVKTTPPNSLGSVRMRSLRCGGFSVPASITLLCGI